MKSNLSMLEREFEAELETQYACDRVLEFTQEVRQVILSSNFSTKNGGKTAGEMFSEWFEMLPYEVREELGIQ